MMKLYKTWQEMEERLTSSIVKRLPLLNRGLLTISWLNQLTNSGKQNEMQFAFNMGVEDFIASAQTAEENGIPTNKAEKSPWRRLLNEGPYAMKMH